MMTSTRYRPQRKKDEQLAKIGKQSEGQTLRAFKKGVIRVGDRCDSLEANVPGLPDINVCINGVESWIEIKAPREPLRADTPLFGSNHKLLPEQIGWMKRQVKAHGNVYILITTDIRYLLVHGGCASSINTATVDEIIGVSLWQSYKPATRSDWDLLRNILQGSGPKVDSTITKLNV